MNLEPWTLVLALWFWNPENCNSNLVSCIEQRTLNLKAWTLNFEPQRISRGIFQNSQRKCPSTTSRNLTKPYKIPYYNTYPRTSDIDSEIGHPKSISINTRKNHLKFLKKSWERFILHIKNGFFHLNTSKSQ